MRRCLLLFACLLSALALVPSAHATPPGGNGELTVTVTTPGAKKATGKLDIRVGTKRVKATVRKGAAKVTLPKLRKGRTRIAVTYVGGAAFERVTAKTITISAR